MQITGRKPQRFSSPSFSVLEKRRGLCYNSDRGRTEVGLYADYHFAREKNEN